MDAVRKCSKCLEWALIVAEREHVESVEPVYQRLWRWPTEDLPCQSETVVLSRAA